MRTRPTRNDEEEELEAKLAELSRHDEFETYEVVCVEQARGKKRIPTRWVIDRPPGRAVRARIVAKELKH